MTSTSTWSWDTSESPSTSSAYTSNANNALLTSNRKTPAASSTPRPRTNRLISIEDNNELRPQTSHNTDGRERGHDRDSNLPVTALPRTGSRLEPDTTRLRPQRSMGSLAPSAGTSRPRSPAFQEGLKTISSGLSGGWSALSGLASSVLASGAAQPATPARTGSSTTLNGTSENIRRRKGGGISNGRLAQAPALDEWGPPGTTSKGKSKDAGARLVRKRDEAARNSKVKAALQSHEGVNGGLAVGSSAPVHAHKRRTSDGEQMQSPRPDDDALVYVHPVKPTDTLAGVILKYNVDPAIFRKANRLWPNDAIQVRKVVLIPVDASGVRGRPCGPPDTNGKGKQKEIDLLSPTPSDEEPPNLAVLPESESPWAGATPVAVPNGRSGGDEDDEQPWTHVRWVQLTTGPSNSPVEIARLPRRTLGYFPPTRRRKSQSTVAGSVSPWGTPRTSLDLMSSSPAAGPGSPAGTRKARAGSNLSQSYFPDVSTLPSHHRAPSSSGTAPLPSSLHSQPSRSFPARTRSNSSLRPPSQAQSQQRIPWFLGPGGVGTFGPNVRQPGPAQDGLNAWTAKHLPNLTLQDIPSMAAYGDLLGFDKDNQPVLAGVGDGGGGIGEGVNWAEAASKVEGWVRALGKGVNISTPVGTPGGRLRRGGGQEVGDLIELLDGAGSEDGRDRGERAGMLGSGSTGWGVSPGAGAGVVGRKGGKSD